MAGVLRVNSSGLVSLALETAITQHFGHQMLWFNNQRNRSLGLRYTRCQRMAIRYAARQGQGTALCQARRRSRRIRLTAATASALVQDPLGRRRALRNLLEIVRDAGTANVRGIRGAEWL